MYNDHARPQPAQISVVQILSVVVIVLIAAVLPMALISTYQTPVTQANVYSASALSQRASETVGQVAGAQTTATSTNNNLISIPGINRTIDLESEAGLLTIGGVLLIGIAGIIFIYLLITPSHKK